MSTIFPERDDTESCYEHPTVATIIVGVVLLIGGFLSFVPQYRAIIRRGTSFGLSYGFLGLALCSNALVAVNSGMLNWWKVECCVTELRNNFTACLRNNLAFMQLLFGAIWVLVLYAMFLGYCRPTPDFPAALQRGVRRRAFLLFVLIMGVVFGVTTCALVFYYKYKLDSAVLIPFADILGYTAATMTCIQFLPQIYTTYKIGGPGSLSVLMLVIQLVGYFLVVFFQGFLNHQKFSTWFPFAVSIVEVAVLLGLVAYYRIFPKEAVDGDMVSLLYEAPVLDGRRTHGISMSPQGKSIR